MHNRIGLWEITKSESTLKTTAELLRKGAHQIWKIFLNGENGFIIFMVRELNTKTYTILWNGGGWGESDQSDSQKIFRGGLIRMWPPRRSGEPSNTEECLTLAKPQCKITILIENFPIFAKSLQNIGKLEGSIFESQKLTNLS